MFFNEPAEGRRKKNQKFNANSLFRNKVFVFLKYGKF